MRKLIFVYNTETGLRNRLIDGLHKIASPKTYDCHLCAITFGVFTEDLTWKKFRESITIEMEFLHKDEFSKKYASKFRCDYTFPIVLDDDGKAELKVIVSAKELKTFRATEDLINCITERV